MQLLRYQDETGASLGVLKGNSVISIRKALQRYVDPDGRLASLGAVAESVSRDPKLFLSLGPAIRSLVQEAIETDDGSSVVTGNGLSSLKVLPFIPDPEKVFGLGYNYKALAAKEGVEEPMYPQVFSKMPTSVNGPFDDVNVPLAIDKVDFEAELGVVIGRTARAVPREKALSYVGGYTIINDVTAKILPRPKTEAQTTTVALKGADGFAPLGAVVVTSDEAGDPSELRILCRVNGEDRQDYPTSDMIHDVAATVAYISSIITLHPGDMISMGTSLGIGIIEIPPRLLKDGDLVECEIAGYPGCRNRFRVPAQRG